MSHMDQTQEGANGAANSGPGAQLRAARAERGLGVAEIASELRLSEALIHALEEGRYDELPPAPFVRGYLRSYARLLHIDGDAVVAAYESDAGEQQAPYVVASPPPADRVHFSPRLAMLLLLGLAVGGAGAWWYLGDPAELMPEQAMLDDEAVAPDEVEPIDPEMLEEPEIEAPATEGPFVVYPELVMPDIATDPEGIAERDEEIEAIFEETPVDADPDAVEEPEPPVAEEQQEQILALDEFPIGTEREFDAAAEASGEPDAEEAPVDPASVSERAEEAVAAADEAGPDQMTLRFGGETWVEVYDDREQRLVYALYGGEEVVDVQGRAPFEIFLGNAPVVEVEFGGETVDVAPFVRANDTARFLLDEEGARAP